MPRSLLLALCCSLLASTPTFAQNGDRKGENQGGLPEDLVVPEAPALTPEQALESLVVQEGFRVELVASDPLIHDPVQISWDAHGDLWVVEMRGYMPSPDGEGEGEPVGRISILHDDDGDGVMDRAEVWLDEIVMPRAVLPLGEGRGRRESLTIEPPHIIHRVDTDGDGKPDTKEILRSGITAGLQNPEHAANSPLHGLDGWIHLANHDEAYKFDGEKWHRRKEPVRGQWGLSQDDYGRLFFNYNSDYLRADLVAPHLTIQNKAYGRSKGINARLDGNQRVYPIRVTPGVNRGYRKGLLKDGKLTRFTATCAPLVMRGHGLGEDALGDVFVCEPSANFVRRAKITDDNGLLKGRNAYDKAEFLASTDERFRPVHLSNGPDGALYVVDLYRGILQHKRFLTTFLRKQIEARGLDKPVGLGRIYRVVREGEQPPAAVADLPSLGSNELAAKLDDPNGWTRSAAQRVLVERNMKGDRYSLPLPFVREFGELGRLHALWAMADTLPLQGAGPTVEKILYAALGWKSPHLQVAALRVGLESGLFDHSESLRVASFGVLKAWSGESVPRPVVWQTMAVAGRFYALDPGFGSALLFEHNDALGNDSTTASLAVASLAGNETLVLGEIHRRALVEVYQAQATPLPVRFARELALAVGRRGDPAEIQTAVELAAGSSSLAFSRAVLDGLASALPKNDKRLGRWKLDAMPKGVSALLDSGDKKLRGLAQRVHDAIAVAEPEPDEVALDDEALVLFEHGRAQYLFCAACHQPNGEGLPGLAPSLVETQWTLGKPERLIRIALHGLEGPIDVDGETWNQPMPKPPEMTDREIAAVLTFIRRSWGNDATPVKPGLVKRVRKQVADRVKPWTEAELKKL